MKKQSVWFYALAVFTLLGLLINSTQVSAQNPPPVYPDGQPARNNAQEYGGPREMQDGLWYQDGPASSVNVLPDGAGGPDEFGYTWTDQVAFNWFDASPGVNIDTSNPYAPIGIGFPFKFYENTYTQLYVSDNGFVSFDGANLSRSQSRIPNPGTPNNVIAPNWVPIDSVGGYVRYMIAGAAPNRWFVVEWNRMLVSADDPTDTDEYTFELFLHENGNIVFQYATMTVIAHKRLNLNQTRR